MIEEPFIPQTVTVHLGAPDAPAENVTVSFPDYIKNVASSELYPTWPEEALRANILAQISFALNRYYTEWYRSQGYDFDITSSTRYDQAFLQNRVIYDNIAEIVDEAFDSYIRRRGTVEPYFTRYCNGVTTVCEGLSQWGTVSLAEQGLSAFEILTRYYGGDIELVEGAPVMAGSPSYPGVPLSLGSIGGDVQLKQLQLNRIAQNYPAIPRIPTPDGLFDLATDAAVRKYQRIFGLAEDGIVGNATWNSLSYIYAAVKRLADLDSEGIAIEELPQQRPEPLSPGDNGDYVRIMQYYLSVVANFYPEVPTLAVTGEFDPPTEAAVRAFQQFSGLPEDGIVGFRTWIALYRAYRGIADTVEPTGGVPPLQTFVLREGDTGAEVRRLQEYLTAVSRVVPALPALTVDGIFGPRTAAAVKGFQQAYDLPVTGIVTALDFDTLIEVYLGVQGNRAPGQYPGYVMGGGV